MVSIRLQLSFHIAQNALKFLKLSHHPRVIRYQLVYQSNSHLRRWRVLPSRLLLVLHKVTKHTHSLPDQRKLRLRIGMIRLFGLQCQLYTVGILLLFYQKAFNSSLFNLSCVAHRLEIVECETSLLGLYSGIPQIATKLSDLLF
jgi:hypothetical protein